MNVVPINVAESIFEPFWDPALSGFKHWHIGKGEEYGLRVTQEWARVTYEWKGKPGTKPALKMYREFNIDCIDFDHVMFSIMAPKKAIIKINIETDQKNLNFQSEPFGDQGKEFFIELNGAKKILRINLEIYPREEGVAIGWLRWIGLHHSERYKHYKKQWERFDDKWVGYLKDESYEPAYQPNYGIVINNNEFKALRKEHDDYIREKGTSPFIKKVEVLRHETPEKNIHEYVNFWTDTRFPRERDYYKRLTLKGPDLAAIGLLLKDKKLLRLAARYAMSMAMCGNWNDSVLCNFPAGHWEHRSFVKSIIAYELGTILDLAGEMFTDLGRDLILRRLGEEAIGGINYITWKHDYIFHNNQLIWFSHGRLLAYAILEQHFNHIKPYTEIAYKEVIENLNNILYEDGGYGEGPSYFNCIGQHASLALYYYSRLRGINFNEVIPEKMKRTADFIECLRSTVDDRDVIPICDGKPLLEQGTLAFMAYLLPDSSWVNLFEKSFARMDGLPSDLIAFKIKQDIQGKKSPIHNFIALPDMGILSSYREIQGEAVKLFIMANKANIDHQHEDKGSFVLEFAGDTFAMDPGSCDYASPLSALLKQCQRHNMLVPYGVNERPHPKTPNHMDIKASGCGDDQKINAQMLLTTGWEEYYKTWIRSWNSISPDMLTIIDEYELRKGEGVEFYWNTQLEVSLRGNNLKIDGQKAQIIIEVPKESTVAIKQLPMYENKPQNQIIIKKQGTKGKLEIKVKLLLKE